MEISVFELEEQFSLQNDLINQQIDLLTDISENQSLIMQNQETIIQQNTDILYNLQEVNSVLVNFFFVFGFLCVCKFIHFILCRVIFGGIN